EKVAVRTNRIVQLIFHNTSLNANPPFIFIHFQYFVHVARQIHHNAFGQRLAICTGTATTRGECDSFVLFLIAQFSDERNILSRSRMDDCLRKLLVNAVVSSDS
ncbi:hypothetical protein D018_1397B, partial [Vibrio parahaemolyticus VP2007-007]